MPGAAWHPDCPTALPQHGSKDDQKGDPNMTSSVVRRLAGLFLFLLLAAPWGVAAEEPPKFLIEKIVVEGVARAAGRQIVADESLLKPGQTYTEPQLRQAVYRVKRLQFVVDAEFSLRKGSERGAYELVIKVEEETPVFFSAEADAERAQQTNFFTGKRRTTTTWQRFGTVGGREFVGSHGLVYGSVEKVQHQDGELVNAGYTQYDLFGAGSFANVELDSTEGVKGYDQLQAFFSAGIPLTAAQSLRTDMGWASSKSIFSVGSSRDAGLFATVSWVYNTTDDPLFPLSGTIGSAAASYRTDALHFVETIPFDIDERATERTLGYGVSGEHFWPLTARQALELELSANVTRASARAEPESQSLQATLTVGHAINLLGYEKAQRFGDLRFENTIVLAYVHDSIVVISPNKSASFVSSLLYRSRWGVLRLSFAYDGLWWNH